MRKAWMVDWFPWLALFALASSVSQARPSTVELLVPAEAGWIDTGIDVERGETVEFSAAGLWSEGGAFIGPAGYPQIIAQTTLVPLVAYAALVGRIGATTFVVGSVSVQKGEGRLFLAMNDTPDGYLDNSGYQAVAIKVTRDMAVRQ